MRVSITDTGLHPMLVRLSYLVLVSLASCAKADPPELFVADPALQDDFTDSLPATGASAGFEYAIIQGIAVYEGDILLGKVDARGALTNRFQARGVGKNDGFSRWPDGIVVYEKPIHNSQVQKDNIDKAIAHWTERTTLSFVERTDENKDKYPHYIKFLNTQSCASHVGMIGLEQPIYLSDACSVGSVIHEIGHAIGLFHEHTRPDRDNFVQIDWSAVADGKDINFNLQTAGVDTYSPYDYGSIMHYGKDFFSSNGNPTIIVADGIDIGQREALSPLDIQSANNMYETDLALAAPTVQSSDGVMEIDLTAYNYGELGAHDIELILRLGDDAQWTGVSQNIAWECLTYSSELKCTLDSFAAGTESRFMVQVNPGSATADDLSARLLSRNQDSDPDNNGWNDDGVEWLSEGIELSSKSTDDDSLGDQVDAVAQAPAEPPLQPQLLAAVANTTSNSNSEANPADTSGSTAVEKSGGSTQMLTLTLLAMMAGIRRRRSL